MAALRDRAGPVSGSRRYCGRDFPEAELDLIRALLAAPDPPLSRTALSRAVCERLDWRKPDGGLKEMSARVALLRMQRDGLLTLPPPLQTIPRPGPLAPSPRTDPPPLAPRPASLAQARPLRLSLLRPSDPRSRLWNEFVERYHYLGYKPLPGAQLRYFVYAADGLLLALLGFGAAAWKTAPRDRFVGWDPPTRQRNLPLVVNHARYLILPGSGSPRWRPTCSPACSDNSPRTGNNATACVPFCWKRSAKPHASRAPAIAPPTGSMWAKPRAAASSILVTNTTSPSRTFSSSLSVRTGKQSSIASSTAASHGPLERLLSDGKLHDVNVLDLLVPEAGAIYVMDRAYLDFERLYTLHQAGASFVTRAKKNLRYHRVYSAPKDRERGILADQTIALDGPRTRQAYPLHLRRVRYRDPESGKLLVFLTNRSDLPATTVCALYKSRWKVELFFRWVKGHLQIQRFFGTSENAVKSQIWIAVSVYALVAIIRKELGIRLSLHTMLEILSVMPFEQVPLYAALTSSEYLPDPISSTQQLNLFDV